MDALAEQLGSKLAHWQPRTSTKVRALVEEIIARADEGTFGPRHSRPVEQEGLDSLDGFAQRYAAYIGAADDLPTDLPEKLDTYIHGRREE